MPSARLIFRLLSTAAECSIARRSSPKQPIGDVGRVSWKKEWRSGDRERHAIFFRDGFHLKVRTERRLVSVPVFAVLSVAEDGRKHLVALQRAVSEAGAHWSSPIADLQQRAVALLDGLAALGQIQLRKIDGHRQVSELLAPVAKAAA